MTLKFLKYLNDDSELPTKPKQGFKRCSACKIECPLSDFVRKATLLQSRSWTKNEKAMKRLEYESRICNTCHSKKRLRAPDLSPEAYRKRLVNEGVNPIKIEARVNARRMRGAIQRKEKTKRTLLKNAMPELRPLLSEITDIENKLANKLLHLRRTGRGESESAVFCAKYGILFADVKQQLKLKAKAGQKIPSSWHTLIPDRFVVDLWDLFRAIPAEHKQRFAPFMSFIPRTPETQ